ncbi:hypothetical protein PHJA_001807700 [Phtheirospermum japonicum]|uniref:Transmembrane protein n=1 Tax=Phtheirospermum japonicum TaxID=374723 RepID=A0A830CBS1_9LAMI|nr:hypothetical protein PHJA_001807700 [Phtheirospermum japonicum]
MANHVDQTNLSPIPVALGLFVSITLLVALCAKHARKYSSETSDQTNTPLKSPLPSAAKQLITNISHKAMMPLVHAKKSGVFGNNNKNNKLGQEESGLWQKAILMGEKCQPPEFSGVIYYDYAGNRIPEMPKSPRAGNMSPFTTFAFTLDNSKY